MVKIKVELCKILLHLKVLPYTRNSSNREYE